MNTTKRISFFLGPLLFVVLYFFFPENLISPRAPKVLALASLMLTWWVTEAVPMPVTAFLPLIGFPLLGVMKIDQSAMPYAHPVIFLFMGGFMIALALEKHKLHERIALRLIRFTGTSGNGIILGFTLATATLSMWISNTATAMMMLPIAVSVVHLLLNGVTNIENLDKKGEKNFATSLLLSIGYASSLGGIATIVGTPPNVVFKGLLEDFFDIRISFGEWMLIGVPVAALLLLANYLLVTRVIFPNKLSKVEGTEAVIAEHLAKLGPMKKSEKLVLVIFSITAFFWIFQQPLNEWLNTKLLNDTTVGMCGGLLMFLVPVDFKKGTFILSWSDTEKLAWGILFLFGGGLCLAEGLDKAGIIGAVGKWIAGQNEFTIWFSLVLIVIAVLLSELMSNVALVNVFVPVVFGVASVMNVNPILMGLPVTLGASIALMFPIATPPNAIVFSSGYIRIQDMVKAGALLNVVSIIIIWVFSITVVQWMFG